MVVAVSWSSGGVGEILASVDKGGFAEFVELVEANG